LDSPRTWTRNGFRQTRFRHCQGNPGSLVPMLSSDRWTGSRERLAGGSRERDCHRPSSPPTLLLVLRRSIEECARTRGWKGRMTGEISDAIELKVKFLRHDLLFLGFVVKVYSHHRFRRNERLCSIQERKSQPPLPNIEGCIFQPSLRRRPGTCILERRLAYQMCHSQVRIFYRFQVRIYCIYLDLKRVSHAI
jgi:hypothetical protein